MSKLACVKDPIWDDGGCVVYVGKEVTLAQITRSQRKCPFLLFYLYTQQNSIIDRAKVYISITMDSLACLQLEAEPDLSSLAAGDAVPLEVSSSFLCLPCGLRLSQASLLQSLSEGKLMFRLIQLNNMSV